MPHELAITLLIVLGSIVVSIIMELCVFAYSEESMTIAELERALCQLPDKDTRDVIVQKGGDPYNYATVTHIEENEDAIVLCTKEDE